MGFLWRQPYLLLVLTTLFWSGNFVLGRAVHDAVPPVALAFWRWAGGFLIVLPFAWPHLARDIAVVRRHLPLVLLLSALGVASFNTLVYLGLGRTTAINGLLIQSFMPLAIIAASLMLFGERINRWQAIGLALSLAGIVAIVARGELATLAALDVNAGDLLIVLAILAYALYTALLRRRPTMHPLSFLAVTFGLGALMLVPLYGWEHVAVRQLAGNPTTFAAIAYVALFPSVLAYLCYNRGVELIGANRAGQFVHLMPVFGSLMAVAFLGESFRLFHAIGIALIFAGILVAARRG
ncbi:DMT family transporter [Desertibaculum subflavum]|uniref:DMT family transporter n=1 Tax=Desertibaculum subflavum TaxID=2268458 RepID=UPI000E6764A8